MVGISQYDDDGNSVSHPAKGISKQFVENLNNKGA